MSKSVSCILFFILFPLITFSQIRDSSIFIPMFSASYAWQTPGGDLKDRFGWNSNVSGTFMIKTKKNFILGAGGDFIFGGQLTPETRGIFDSLKNSSGKIVSFDGDDADILLSERGFYFWGKAGYLMPVRRINPNSGFLFTLSSGFFQHKIRIENDGNNTPEILGDYRKGYDRLTNGLAVSEFAGVIYFGKYKLINFYAGFEFLQSWTRCRRDFDFDTRQQETKLRNDLLFGFRAGWIVPLYRRVATGYYFN